MESKYYTPEIEEFHIGFEYQTYMMSTGGLTIMDMSDWTYTRISEPTNLMWFTTQFRFSEKGPLDTPYTLEQIKKFLKEDRVRVKYLDQEDLESLGWKANHHSYGVNYIKDNYTLSWIYDKIRIEILHEKEGRFFVGEIKNKSELRRIMKQIQIL